MFPISMHGMANHGVFHFGAFGVDLFFVLSGFIILHAHWFYIGKRDRFFEYLWRRWTRIYPPFFVALTIFLPFYWWKDEPTRHWWPIVSNYLLLPGHDGILRVSWTLSFEIFFYLIFSSLIYWGKNATILICAWALAIALAPFICSQTGLAQNFFFFPINLEFIYGLLIAFLVQRLPYLRRFANAALVTGSILIFIDLIFAARGKKLDNYRALFLGVPSALIVYGVAIKQIKFHKGLALLGDASYSIYLVHYSFLWVYHVLVFALGLKDNFAAILLALPFTVLASLGFYFLVEKPLLAYFKGLKNNVAV